MTNCVKKNWIRYPPGVDGPGLEKLPVSKAVVWFYRRLNFQKARALFPGYNRAPKSGRYIRLE